ncbi:hypothetical protein BLA13014_04110 [Burkholderia aenigmatica]|uniref:Uncharacterized protein n=1 Tax=Burkholderia aenigmatica TaxID=2015348 RepID=A0A6P2MSC1_9BURK|nr:MULTISPECIES: hypothetical protein [Burkholderia]VWB88767.1 hypothetical protein BLA13014_04110 [Burkholderia aenigmatica]
MKLTARDVGKLFTRKLGRPMEYLGEEDGRFLFVFRDPPRDHLAYGADDLWMIERHRPDAAPVRKEGPRG